MNLLNNCTSETISAKKIIYKIKEKMLKLFKLFKKFVLNLFSYT